VILFFGNSYGEKKIKLDFQIINEKFPILVSSFIKFSPSFMDE
jgi:hypothetical protein